MTAADYRIQVIAGWRLGCIERAEADRREEPRGWFVPAQRTPSP